MRERDKERERERESEGKREREREKDEEVEKKDERMYKKTYRFEWVNFIYEIRIGKKIEVKKKK